MSNNNVIPAEALGQWKSWRFGELGADPAQQLPPEAPADISEPPEQGVSVLEAVPDVQQPEPEAAESEPEAAPLAYPTAAELEAIHQEAWQAGFDAGQQEGMQQGRAAGEAAAQAEVAARFAEHWQPLQELQQAFEQQLQQLGQQLSGDVLTLSAELAERIVAAHIALDHAAILPLVQQALDEVGQGLLQAKVRAHPADIGVIEHFVTQQYPGVSWHWVADEGVARGGCLIETSQRKIDLSLPQRLQALRRALGVNDD